MLRLIKSLAFIATPSKAKLLLLHLKYPPFEIGSIYFKNVWFESNSQNSVAILQDVRLNFTESIQLCNWEIRFWEIYYCKTLDAVVFCVPWNNRD